MTGAASGARTADIGVAEPGHLFGLLMGMFDLRIDIDEGRRTDEFIFRLTRDPSSSHFQLRRNPGTPQRYRRAHGSRSATRCGATPWQGAAAPEPDPILHPESSP
jgi:hypothetical protein